MNSQMQLEINKPCSEKFRNFKKTNSGGFCNSCNKEVIDFTKMTSQEIILYFQKPKISTCGIFNKTQLTNYQEKLIPKNRWQFRALATVGFSILSLLSVNNLNAQTQKNSTEIKIDSIVKSTEKPKEQIVKGTISDETGNLPGVNILLEGSTIGTETDFDGKFTFPKPLIKGDVLIFRYIGYEAQKVTIADNQIDINLKFKYDDTIIMMGKVNVKKVYKTKRSFWEKISFWK